MSFPIDEQHVFNSLHTKNLTTVCLNFTSHQFQRLFQKNVSVSGSKVQKTDGMTNWKSLILNNTVLLF